MFLQHKISYLAIGIIAIVFLAGILFFNYENNDAPRAMAAPAVGDLSGFAWSENIGWISFNSINCDINGDGTYQGGAEGAPLGCPTSGTAKAYSVNLNSGTGELSGYAWNDNIGWISFQAADIASCPAGTCQPRLTGSDLSGWARALSNGGGWDGWISLNCVNSGVCGVSNYKVSKSGNNFTGFAWGGDVVGWIEFNAAFGGVHLTNIPPAVVPLNPLAPDYCVAPGVAGVRFSWNFSDIEDANVQTKYQLIISREDGKTYNSGIKISSATDIYGTAINSDVINCTPGPSCANFIDYGSHTYAWIIKVWDSGGLSDEKTGVSFGPTPVHEYPDVNFTCSPDLGVSCPTDHSLMEIIEFNGNIGGSYGPYTYEWDFGDGTLHSFTQNTTHTYATAGTRNLHFIVTDTGAGLMCDSFAVNASKINIDNTVSPEWKEVKP